MRTLITVPALLFCLSLAGCVSSLRIKPAPDLKKPQGLLFYTKVGACKQQTVWLEYRYELSGEKFGPVIVNQQTYTTLMKEPAVTSSAERLASYFAGNSIPAVSPFVSDLDANAFATPDRGGNLTLAANTGEFTSVVDYTNPMWLNSGRPLAGSTQVSGKFSPDGTLTEVSAQIDNATLSTILTAVTSIVGIAAPKIASAAEPKPFQLTVKVSARAHTHVHLTPVKGADLSAALANCGPSSTPITDGSWVITDTLQPASDPGKKADDKAADGKKS